MIEKIYNFKNKKNEFIFWKNKIICFVNVETDPRLEYLRTTVSSVKWAMVW
jgi:hypothetical protein